MSDNKKKSPRAQRVRNESVSLYDMGVDDVLETEGFVVLDSSLGLVPPSRGKTPLATHDKKKA